MVVFLGDTVRISTSTGIDLSSYTTLRIDYRDPNGGIGFWIATMDTVNHTLMYFDTLVTTLNIVGDWLLQAHVEKTGSRLHGDWTPLHVNAPIS